MVKNSNANTSPIVGVLFMGGEGKRLGLGPKTDVMLGGKTLFEHVYSQLNSQSDELVLSSKANQPNYPLETIIDDPSLGDGQGPIVGLLSVLRWASLYRPTASIITSPIDTPFLPENYVTKLLTGLASEGEASVACSGDYLHGLCAAYRPTAIKIVEAFWGEGGRKIRDLHAVLKSQKVEFIADPDPFLNINTQADLDRAKTYLPD